MNPNIDLRSFSGGAATEAQPFQASALVSPPRRIVTRYVLPLSLFAAFVAVSAYAARDALVPAVEVRVVQPVLASGVSGVVVGGDDSVPQSAGTADAAGDTPPSPIPAPSNAGGAPLFQAPGWVEPDPFTTMVSSLVAGTVAAVHVREGQTVKAGEVVAELDSGDAKIAVRKSHANLSVRTAELEAARANWENPIALNEQVKTAQAEKARLEAERVKTERQAQFSRKQAEISRTLGLSGADSRLAGDKATLEAGIAEATLLEIDAKIRSQAASTEAAEQNAKLRLEDKSRLQLAEAQVEEAKAAIDEARLRLARCQITAPTSGTVMRIHATPGSMVSMDVQHGTQIVSMYDPTQLQVRAEVPLAEAGKIKIGLPAEIRVEAMPDKVFMGELTRIVHEADVQRNSLPVKVRLLNPDPTLKPEMVARLQFKSLPKPAAKPAEQLEAGAPTEAREETPIGSGLFVPGTLLPKDAKGDTHLWVVGPDMKAHQKKITLGSNRRGDLHEVSAGLQLSDKLIVSNLDKLKENSRVRIAGMN